MALFKSRAVGRFKSLGGQEINLRPFLKKKILLFRQKTRRGVIAPPAPCSDGLGYEELKSTNKTYLDGCTEYNKGNINLSRCLKLI